MSRALETVHLKYWVLLFSSMFKKGESKVQEMLKGLLGWWRRILFSIAEQKLRQIWLLSMNVLGVNAWERQQSMYIQFVTVYTLSVKKHNWKLEGSYLPTRGWPSWVMSYWYSWRQKKKTQTPKLLPCFSTIGFEQNWMIWVPLLTQYWISVVHQVLPRQYVPYGQSFTVKWNSFLRYL